MPLAKLFSRMTNARAGGLWPRQPSELVDLGRLSTTLQRRYEACCDKDGPQSPEALILGGLWGRAQRAEATFGRTASQEQLDPALVDYLEQQPDLEPAEEAGPRRKKIVAKAEKRVTFDGTLSTKAVQDVLVNASAELHSAKPIVEMRGDPQLVGRKTVQTEGGYAVVEQVSVELLITTMKEVSLFADVLSRCNLEGTTLTLKSHEEPTEVTVRESVQ